MAGGTGRFRHYLVTIPNPAAAIQLSSGIPAGEERAHALQVFEYLDVQPKNGAAVCSVGGDSTLAASEGMEVQTPAAGDVPYRIPGPVKLTDIWVIGTAGNVINVFGKTL